MTAKQGNMFGNPAPRTGLGLVADQLAEIMENQPKTVDDEDWLAATWFLRYGGLDEAISLCNHDTPLWGIEFCRLRLVAGIIRAYRKANIRERRRELKPLYPYSPEEEARRQKRGRGGRP